MSEIQEPATGAIFPSTLRPWDGGVYKNLGAGPRIMKVAFISIKVYAVSLYVPIERLPLASGTALSEAGFPRVIQMQLARNIAGSQFSDTMRKSMGPSMSHDLAGLTKFCDFITQQQLQTGTVITLLLGPASEVDVNVDQVSAVSGGDMSQAKPQLSLQSEAFCASLLQIYLGPKSVIPEAKKAWLANAVRG
ncbi:hypothetical protein ACKKBG_A03485 [Auxenochlorella protothecoides x Auxenochlorella symbiontica]